MGVARRTALISKKRHVVLLLQQPNAPRMTTMKMMGIMATALTMMMTMALDNHGLRKPPRQSRVLNVVVRKTNLNPTTQKRILLTRQTKSLTRRAKRGNSRRRSPDTTAVTKTGSKMMKRIRTTLNRMTKNELALFFVCLLALAVGHCNGEQAFFSK